MKDETCSTGPARAGRGSAPGADKEELYRQSLMLLRQLLARTDNEVARMATIAAVLASHFPHFSWVGFYLLDGGDLTVGPYQGLPACLVLERHKGVCWAGVDRAEVVIVPDVHEFPGHIVCDEQASSEIVVPLLDRTGWVCGVLDVDSREFDAFDELDSTYLKQVVALVHG